MKAVNQDRENLLKESRRIYRNLSKRMRRIQGLSDLQDIPDYAFYKFRELQENTPRDIRTLNDEELLQYYRDLKYISGLKSSTVKGAKSIQNKWEPVREILNTLSKDTKDKFWSVYKRLYEEGGVRERFKYEVFGNTISRMLQGTDVDRIKDDITKLYDSLIKEGVDDDELPIRFSEGLNELLR